MQICIRIDDCTKTIPPVTNDILPYGNIVLTMLRMYVVNQVNFDVDFLKPQCLVEWRYTHSFYLQLMFPIIMAVVAFTRFAYAFLCTKVLFTDVSYRTRNSPLFKNVFTHLDASTDDDSLRFMMDAR